MIKICAIGTLKNHVLAPLADDYQKRITWPLSIHEIAIRKKLTGTELQEAEGAALLEAAGDSFIVMLDGGGKTYDSAGFAATISNWRENHKSIVFLIGGSDGHTDSVKKRAGATLSFGALTWPHLLARVMLLEQIYRAQCIASGHPYHK